MNNNSALPSGWEARYDKNTGKTYYINHYEKTTTWDHPSTIKKTSVNKSSGKQMNGTPRHHKTSLGVETIPLQEFSNRTGSSLTVKPKESSLTNATDVDEAVSKIGAMFPTVSEPHIQLLMKNCRYMKSIFPQAEETIILDILSNNDNNIQKSSDKLREMGYEKKDSLKISQQKHQAKIDAKAVKSPKKSPIPVPKMKSAEEKERVEKELQKDHPDIPKQLVKMALESVDFDKVKASNLLKTSSEDVIQTDKGKFVVMSENENDGAVEVKSNVMPISQSRQSLKSLLKSEKGNENDKNSFNRVIGEIGLNKSRYLSNTNGPNPSLAKGNDDKLLLEDYVNWQGPNPNLRRGPGQSVAKGPNASLRIGQSVRAFGPNASYRIGQNKTLAKGSIFQQIKASIVISDESRGK